MALPSPGSSFSSGGAPSGGINQRRPNETDYRDRFRQGSQNFMPGRGMSVAQIYAQRENRPNARYADGSPLPAGMPYTIGGWSGNYGRGQGGGQGRRPIMGYSYEDQGTARTKRSDYSPHFGGLNEFHQMNQGMSEWDRLQNNAQMDRTDAMGSQLAQLSRNAQMRGDYDTAEAFSNALSDRMAQRMAAGGSSQPFVGPEGGVYSGMGELTYMPGGTAPGLDPNSVAVQAMLDQNMLDRRGDMIQTGPGSFRTPYGDVGSTQGQNIGPFGTQSTFTNAQGSAGPGGAQTFYGGVQSGPDFFRQAADRQRQGNKFAQPAPGYNGKPADDLDAYSERLLAAKKKLGKA